ncbi:MAG TPA: zinc ribbon domain-containing protein [Micromonosporaceae bacterium]|jgi:putative FmdB family regulatory protein
MPRYDYRCRQCGATFEVSRSITASVSAVTCPDGHDDTVKLLSTVAIGGLAASGVRSSAPAGGCCGGACCGG